MPLLTSLYESMQNWIETGFLFGLYLLFLVETSPLVVGIFLVSLSCILHRASTLSLVSSNIHQTYHHLNSTLGFYWSSSLPNRIFCKMCPTAFVASNLNCMNCFPHLYDSSIHHVTLCSYRSNTILTSIYIRIFSCDILPWVVVLSWMLCEFFYQCLVSRHVLCHRPLTIKMSGITHVDSIVDSWDLMLHIQVVLREIQAFPCNAPKLHTTTPPSNSWKLYIFLQFSNLRWWNELLNKIIS